MDFGKKSRRVVVRDHLYRTQGTTRIAHTLDYFCRFQYRSSRMQKEMEIFVTYANISYQAARRYTPADRGGSTSVCGRIRSPHSSGGLQGSCGTTVLGAAHLGHLGQTDGKQTDG